MITILCAGSRGDFQPYIALAMELKKNGRDVRIAGSRSFEGFVRSYGIDFYPIQADFASVNVDPKVIKAAQSADNPLKMLLTFNKMKEYGVYMTNDFYSACEGSELIIYHPGVTIGYFAAEQLGIPSVLASPFPLHKTQEQMSVIMYGRIKSTPITNRLSYSILQGMLWLASKASVKEFWKVRFGKAPDNFVRPFERHRDHNHPAIISCSNFVFKRPSDWNENIHQSGYWFVDEEVDYTPSDEMASFLDTGEKPIYFGFGSVFSFDEKEKMTELILDALKKSGKRGIISGMGRITNLPPDVIATDSMPHSWLFERVLAVCHHGGAGTTAAGFRAGVPSIIIPFSNDQFAWAHRAYDLGVASKPIPRKKLTSGRLQEAISYALQERIIINAKKLGRNLASENGTMMSAKAVIECLER